MAADGKIPGTSRTMGGHWRVKNDADLKGWLAAMTFAKIEREALGRDQAAPLFNAVVKFEQTLDVVVSSLVTKGNIYSMISAKDYLLGTQEKICLALAKFEASLDFAYKAQALEAAKRSSSLNG